MSLPAAIQKEKGRGAVPENILGSSVVPFSERLWWFGLASTFELLLDVSFLTGLVQKSFAFFMSQEKAKQEEEQSSLIIKP